MVARQRVGNLLGLAVLSYLMQGPMHPYELARTLKAHGDDRSIKFNQGSLYSVFDQLARAGLITEHETSRDGRRPERTSYMLTEAGRAEQQSWLRDLVEDPRYEYPQFVAALSLIAVLGPDQTVDLLRRRLARLAAQADEIRTYTDQCAAGGLHPLFLVEEDYRLQMLTAEIAFVERLIERITDPDTGWAPQWAAFFRQPPSDEPPQHEGPRS